MLLGEGDLVMLVVLGVWEGVFFLVIFCCGSIVIVKILIIVGWMFIKFVSNWIFLVVKVWEVVVVDVFWFDLCWLCLSIFYDVGFIFVGVVVLLLLLFELFIFILRVVVLLIFILWSCLVFCCWLRIFLLVSILNLVLLFFELLLLLFFVLFVGVFVIWVVLGVFFGDGRVEDGVGEWVLLREVWLIGLMVGLKWVGRLRIFVIWCVFLFGELAILSLYVLLVLLLVLCLLCVVWSMLM